MSKPLADPFSIEIEGWVGIGRGDDQGAWLQRECHGPRRASCLRRTARGDDAAVATAANLPHVAANARRVNAAGDGCAMTDGIALAAEPLSRDPFAASGAGADDQIVELRCGRVEHRLHIETRPHRGQANRDARFRCRNTSSPTITRLTTLAPTPAANAGAVGAEVIIKYARGPTTDGHATAAAQQERREFANRLPTPETTREWPGCRPE